MIYNTPKIPNLPVHQLDAHLMLAKWKSKGIYSRDRFSFRRAPLLLQTRAGYPDNLVTSSATSEKGRKVVLVCDGG